MGVGRWETSGFFTGEAAADEAIAGEAVRLGRTEVSLFSAPERVGFPFLRCTVRG